MTKTTQADRPLILLTNDDGYDATGLQALASALADFARVIVIAPSTQQSACSHKLTLHRPVRLREHGRDRYSVDGTPADCVYVGMYCRSLMQRQPDLVVSGINLGANLGADIYYSGTVAGAREAAMRGVPGLALSMDPETDLRQATAMGVLLVRAILDSTGSGLVTVVNANLPKHGTWRLVQTRLGERMYRDAVELRVDPRGERYAWVGGPLIGNRGEPGTDAHAHEEGLVGLTPLAVRAEDHARAVSFVEAVIHRMAWPSTCVEAAPASNPQVNNGVA